MKNFQLNEDNIDEFLQEKFKLPTEDREIPDDARDALMRGFQLAKREEEQKKKQKATQLRLNVDIKTIPLSKLLLISAIVFALTLPAATGGSYVVEIFKNSMRMDTVGIDNTELYEYAFEHNLITYTNMEYIPIDDNYSIKIDSLLADGVNYYFGFSLKSKSPLSNDMRFAIEDLQIIDKNGEVLINELTGYSDIVFSKSMYSGENEIRELISFTDTEYKLNSLDDLNISFTLIDIYKYDNKFPTSYNYINTNFSYLLEIDKQDFIYEYYDIKKVAADGSVNITNVMRTNIGLYVFSEINANNTDELSLRYNGKEYISSYNIPISFSVVTNINTKFDIFKLPETENDIVLFDKNNEFKLELKKD